jgi:hypothetical protein
MNPSAKELNPIPVGGRIKGQQEWKHLQTPTLPSQAAWNLTHGEKGSLNPPGVHGGLNLPLILPTMPPGEKQRNVGTEQRERENYHPWRLTTTET